MPLSHCFRRIIAFFALTCTAFSPLRAQEPRSTPSLSLAQVGHHATILDLEFSPDGRTLASCGFEGTVKLWNSVTGRLTANIEAEDRIWDLAYAPDGTLAGACGDGFIRLWGRDGHLIRAFGGPPQHVARGWGSIAFSPDGSLLATVDSDANVYVWNPQTGASRWVLKTTSAHLVRVAFSRQNVLAAGSLDGRIWLWNGKNGRAMRTLIVDHPTVDNLQFSPAYSYLLSGGEGGHLFMYYPKKAKSASFFLYEMGDVRGIAFAPKDERIGFISKGGDVTLMPTEDKPNVVIPAPSPSAMVWSMAFSPSGQTLATGTMNGDIMLRDPRTGASRKTLTAARIPTFTSFSNSPDGTKLAVGLEGLGPDRSAGGVFLLDAATGKLTRTFQAHKSRIFDTTLSADNKLLATATGVAGKQELALWDLVSGRLFWRRTAPGVAPLRFAPDGKSLLTGERKFALNYWSLKDGHFLREVSTHPIIKTPQPPTEYYYTITTNLIILPNGSFATIEESSKFNLWTARLILWDGVTGKERYRVTLDSIILDSPQGRLLNQTYLFDGIESVIKRSRCSDDGSTLAIPIMGQLQLRDAATGQLQRTLYAESATGPGFYDFDITTDSRKIVTNDGRVYDMATGDCVVKFQPSLIGGRRHSIFTFRVPGEAADRAATMDHSGAIRFWDTADGHLISTTQILGITKTKAGFTTKWAMR